MTRDPSFRSAPQRQLIPFVGRDTELAALHDWIAADQPEGKRAGVLIGHPGRGKSAILKALRDRNESRASAQPRWFVQLLPITGQQQAAQAMEHLLGHMLHDYKGLVKSGPRDAEGLRALIKLVPKAGDLLAYFIRHDTRPGWQRFLDFANALSDVVVKRGSRLVFLIDPQAELRLGSPGDWLPLAQQLPEAVRLIVAQRPDDTLARDRDARLAFTPLLTRPLGDLPRAKIEEWYFAEFAGGQLQAFDRTMERQVASAAYERYAGYPLAHRAVIGVLSNERVDSQRLPALIDKLPEQVEGLMDVLYDKIGSLGDLARRAALMLQIFSIPAPRDVWGRAVCSDPVAFAGLLEDRRFTYLFEIVETQFGPAHTPFHNLFAERLEKSLTADDAGRAALADDAWSAIEPQLTTESLAERRAPFFALSAAVPVAVRCDDARQLLHTISRLFALKMRFGLLDEAAVDMQLSFRVFNKTPEIVAAAHGNLGLIMRKRGDLDGAEAMHRKALEIDERLGRLEGMASDYGNLGIIMRKRGELDGAEVMLRKSLEIFGKLGHQEHMASTYGNLGLIMQTRGDLDGAETMHRKSLEINEKLGRLEGMAGDYGNLGAVMAKRGNFEQARESWIKSRDLFARLGATHMVEKVQGWIDSLPQ